MHHPVAIRLVQFWVKCPIKRREENTAVQSAWAEMLCLCSRSSQSPLFYLLFFLKREWKETFFSPVLFLFSSVSANFQIIQFKAPHNSKKTTKLFVLCPQHQKIWRIRNAAQFKEISLKETPDDCNKKTPNLLYSKSFCEDVGWSSGSAEFRAGPLMRRHARAAGTNPKWLRQQSRKLITFMRA